MSSFEDQVQQHIMDYNNPHRVDKLDVGLGLVENLPIADQPTAMEGVSTQHYVTPRRIRDVFDGILMREGLMDEEGNIIHPA